MEKLKSVLIMLGGLIECVIFISRNRGSHLDSVTWILEKLHGILRFNHHAPCCRFRMLKVVAGHKYFHDIAIVDLHGNNERAKLAESTEVTP